jgi:hypothetical protein
MKLVIAAASSSHGLIVLTPHTVCHLQVTFLGDMNCVVMLYIDSSPAKPKATARVEPIGLRHLSIAVLSLQPTALPDRSEPATSGSFRYMVMRTVEITR